VNDQKSGRASQRSGTNPERPSDIGWGWKVSEGQRLRCRRHNRAISGSLAGKYGSQ